MLKVRLNNGNEMPQLGIGTFMASGDEQAKQAVLAALKSGYRLIDTAHAYNDEVGVGQAISESDVPREEIFLVSKIWPAEYGEGKTLPAVDEMLKRLDTDHIDLLLLHQPFGDALGAYKELEKAVEQGKIRNIGISNFEQYKFDEIVENSVIKPVVHQMECHPYRQLKDMREKMAEYGIKVMCWYPLGGRGEGGKNAILNDPIILKIAQNHNKPAVQIVLRFEMQEGFIVIPGSFNPIHIEENFHSQDFELSEEEMNEIRALNKEQRFFTAFESFSYEQAENMILGMHE